MQQFLKATTGTAWAGIVPTKLLNEYLVDIHQPFIALDLGLGWEAAFTLACCLETRIGRGAFGSCSWHTSGK